MRDETKTLPLEDFEGGRSDRLAEIVTDALELEGEDRRAMVEDACADDVALRAEVMTLLREHDLGETDHLAVPLLERMGSGQNEAATATVEELEHDQTIGPYRLLRQLGAGGMGTVYLAEQDEPVKRQVALKVIRVIQQPKIRRRFAAECQALARLSHPNIAALYQVGATQNHGTGSWPYVAMEWVDGMCITDWCDTRRASVEERIRLFLDVCAGIRHAHEKGVLHCDLKPSNVLVTKVDGRPTAKVIDFGIARALDEPLIEDSQLTNELFMGSPLYVSPEAARAGGRSTLDTRSDVYCLGLLLFELLTGVLPFEAEKRPLWVLLRRLNEEDPPSPSDRLRSLTPDLEQVIAASRKTTPKRLQRRLGGDLDAVVARAIARDPSQRYGSVAELAKELRRHLAHRPVKARAHSTSYLVSRFVRRNVGKVFSVSLVAVALVAGLIARTVEARRANAEAVRARAALEESEQVRQFMVDLFRAADPDWEPGAVLTVDTLLEQGAERLREDLAEQPVARALLLQTIGSIYNKLSQFEAAETILREALDARLSVLPENDPRVLESQSELGVVLRKRGRYLESGRLLERALAIRRDDPGTDPELLALSYNNLGNLRWQEERYADAEAAHRAALAIRIRLGHPGNEAISTNNLGVLLLSRRRYDEAAPMLKRAIELLEDVHGPDHPQVAAGLNNLGLVSRHLASWAEARDLFRRASAIWDPTYGRDHSRSLLARRNLASELALVHRWDESIAESASIVASSERLEDPLALAGALRQKGSTERRAGRLEEAMQTLERARAVAIEAVGPDASLSLHIESTIARTLAKLGRLEEAQAMLDQIAQHQDRTLPPDHPSRLRTDDHRAWIAHDAGDYERAEAYHRRVLASRTENLGARHLRVADSLRNLGRALAAQDRIEGAAELFGRALDIYRSSYDDHPYTASTAHAWGVVEAQRGNTARARNLLEQAVAIRRRHFPADDPYLRAAIDDLNALAD